MWIFFGWRRFDFGRVWSRFGLAWFRFGLGLAWVWIGFGLVWIGWVWISFVICLETVGFGLGSNFVRSGFGFG